MRTALVLGILLGVALAGGADQAASLLKKGEAQKAAETAKRLADKDAGNIDAWLVLADAYVELDEPSSAWDALIPAIERNPDELRLAIKLGDVFIKLAEKEQRTTGDGTTITNFYLDAERMYDEVLAKDPKSAPAVYGKAFASFYRDKKDDAKKYVAECLGIDPEYGRAHALQAYLFYTDGLVLRQQGKEQQALEKFRAAQAKYEISLKLDKSDVFDFVRYGHTFYAQGKMDEAEAAYVDGLRHFPRDKTPIVSGLYYIAGRDFRAAVPYLKNAAKAVPTSPYVWFYLGYGHFLNSAFDEAGDAFGKAAALDKENPQYLYYVGWTIEQNGDGEKALDHYRKVLRLAPQYNDAAARFEKLIQNKNDLEAIEPLYEELLVLAPGYGWGQNNFALILRDWAEQRGAAKTDKPGSDVLRRIKRSAEVYEMAAANLPDDAQIQSDTGLLFEYYPAIRDDEKALRYFTRSLEISDYTYRDAFDGLDRLCRRTGDWATLRDYADGVLGSLEDQGRQAVAPAGGGPPQPLKHETPRMIARAKLALKDAEAHLKQ